MSCCCWVKEDEDYALLLRQRWRERFCASGGCICISIVTVFLIVLLVPYLMGHYVVCYFDGGCDWNLAVTWGWGFLISLSWGAGLSLALCFVAALGCYRRSLCRPEASPSSPPLPLPPPLPVTEPSSSAELPSRPLLVIRQLDQT